MIANGLKWEKPSTEDRIAGVLKDMKPGTKEGLLVWLCEEITALPEHLYSEYMDILEQEIGHEHSLVALLRDIRKESGE